MHVIRAYKCGIWGQRRVPWGGGIHTEYRKMSHTQLNKKKGERKWKLMDTGMTKLNKNYECVLRVFELKYYV